MAKVLRGIELGLALAAAGAYAWRFAMLASGPVYCYSTSTGALGCYGLFESSLLTTVVGLGLLVAAGIVAAVVHALRGSRVARRVLWVLAVGLTVYALLGILTIGLTLLPSAVLLLLAALCSLGVRPAERRGTRRDSEYAADA